MPTEGFQRGGEAELGAIRPSETASKVPPPERNKRLGMPGFFDNRQLRQLRQQRLDLLQIERVEALGEPPVDRRE